MAIVIASDIHGSTVWTRRLLDACEAEQASQLLLLGDFLYHGPRNPLPEGYDPKIVAELLNAHAGRIVALRGNCDSEVDAMVLGFPLVETAWVVVDGHRFFCSHGHRFHDKNPPPMEKGDTVVFGHTHVHLLLKRNGVYFMNPGSVSLPKQDRPHTYMVYREHGCHIKDFNGIVLDSIQLQKKTM